MKGFLDRQLVPPGHFSNHTTFQACQTMLKIIEGDVVSSRVDQASYMRSS
jgi:hypothetical protein